MVNFYKTQIQLGKITIEDVPNKWKEKVLKKLESE